MQLNTELIKKLQCDLYGNRGTDISAAYEFMLDLAKTSNGEPAFVLTGAQVLVNTICNALMAESGEL
jgi:hypothetical protein